MRRRNMRIPIVTSLVLLFIIGAWSLLEWKLYPSMLAIAELTMRDRICVELDEVCERDPDLQEMDYESLVTLEYDNTGKVIALTTDMGDLNRLRNGIVSQVTKQINADGRGEIRIPMAAALNLPFFVGLGPNLSVEVLDISRIGAEFQNNFESAGINQTRHQIQLVVFGEVMLLLPGGIEKVEIRTTVTLAETILLGDVPQTYAVLGNFGNASDSNAEE